jgi:5'-nucleotidase
VNKLNKLNLGYGQSLRRLSVAALLVMCTALSSGCYWQKVVRDINRAGYLGNEPWWCLGASDSGSTVLTGVECKNLSLQFDGAVFRANMYLTVGDLPVGATLLGSTPNGMGAAYQMSATLPTVFEPNNPNIRLYAGTTADSRIVGVAWLVDSVAAPAGFSGDRDVWVPDGSGNWWLQAWIMQGYQNHPNVFASTHPCLNASGAIAHTETSTCFTDSHTEPLEILVTNDDGVGAEGIDELVEALILEPNVSVTVVAPKLNQSGSSDQTSPISELSEVDPPLTTLSGYPAISIESTDLDPPRNGSGSPADAVRWGLIQKNLSPDIVISGTNAGQNVGPASAASGTVGAARTARRSGVPAIATSTGGEVNILGPYDYPTSVDETLKLFREWRLGERPNTIFTVHSINIPSCETGFSLRGTIESVLTVGGCIPPTNDWLTQSCDPGAGVPVVDGATDVEAFHNGYVSIADVGRATVGTCPP